MHVVYPGSFDPLTNGHLAIVERASRLFEKVTVLISVNPEKKSWLNLEEKIELTQRIFQENSKVKVDHFSGLLVEYVKSNKIDAIIKGVRSEADLHNESIMSEVNSQIGAGIETLVLLSKGSLQGVSSSLVRQVYQLGGDISSFVPKQVLDFIEKK